MAGMPPDTASPNQSIDTAGPLLIIGRNGMLGRAFIELCQREKISFEAVDVPEIDLTRRESVAGVVKPQFKLVVNCAAWTDVDGAETNESAATEVNGQGVANLADVCNRAGITVVHYSTDYVFDGSGSQPYSVDHPINPIGAYGRSKAVGEKKLSEIGGSYLCVRTSWLYAPWGKNFVLTIARLAREKESLRVVNDQVGRPSSSQALAANTLRLVQSGATGVFHLTDGGQCSWFDLATRIAAKVASSCRVEPCSSDEYPRPARRPAYSVLDLSKAESILGPLNPWETELDKVLALAK
jgi:dTDP-4-dehydrorhamnose reductase